MNGISAIPFWAGAAPVSFQRKKPVPSFVGFGIIKSACQRATSSCTACSGRSVPAASLGLDVEAYQRHELEVEPGQRGGRQFKRNDRSGLDPETGRRVG